LVAAVLAAAEFQEVGMAQAAAVVQQLKIFL
jgi:hypothetical protein